jgi:sarcosine oxidase subunit alpha
MTSQRVAGFGRVDRGARVSFTFDGRELTGHPGDTLASALLANGIRRVSTSVKYGRPRGILAAGAEDSSGLVQVDRPFPEPMLLASTVEIAPGLVAHGLPGRGALAEEPDPARYDAVHRHVDVAVVGAGPAGLVVALTAARAGLRVALVDERTEAGGSLLGTPDTPDDRSALDWVADVVAELATYPDVTHLQRSTGFGLYDDGLLLALERRTDHLGDTAPPHTSRQRVWRLRAREVVVATGAHERPVVFADNDRPGVLLAGAARELLHRYGVRVGARVVLFTTHGSALPVATELAAAGAQIVAVVDAREGRFVAAVLGDEDVTGVRLSDGTELAADTLLVSGGWNPAVHLFSQAGGKLRYDPALGAFVPAAPIEGVTVVGSAAGRLDPAAVLRDARRAATHLVRPARPEPVDGPPEPVGARDSDGEPGVVCWSVRPAGVDPATLTRHFVDLQRDATLADVARATGAGLTSVEHVKRYTTIGTAHDQGKTSGVIASGIVAELTGVDVAALGTTTFRPPYAPVGFAALAGRDRGQLYEPVRVTAVHDWHVEHGAVFEDVGQWKRPRYYPLPGEDLDAAVRRETAAVRTGVGILDGSTLGTIDVRGADAGAFLDLIYTNLMSTLKIDMVRYGVMCGVDGMVIDDGTVLRKAVDHYLVFTTTGGAAKILDWMEEWLQTEWPHLRVSLTSVTDQWATFPVVGPSSRQLIGAVFGDVDVRNEAFPFMAVRETELGAGAARVPVWLARVSFSGELAYEVNVASTYALSLWEKLIAAGEAFGLTPYGTETMHVLRAEKGYPIIGQDTDGTVTPHDLALSWAVSKKKIDFIGKRSLARPITTAPGRRQLVGLLPVDAATVLHEGSQLVAVDDISTPPVPMLGFVTSSYASAALGRPFALALVADGFARIGTELRAVNGRTVVPVQVTSHVLFDPEGARRDG